MADRNWFRNGSWDREIEEEFFKKLSRARDKAQYLKIQAGCLTEKYPQAALALLSRFFAIGSDSIFKAEAFLFEAQAHLSMENQQKAIESFQKALQRERELPNVVTSAWSEYGLLVSVKRISELFDDALKALQEREARLRFPIEHFRWHAIYALIADARSEHPSAKEHAHKALHFAGLVHSGLSHHPNIGLVGAKEEPLKEKLRWIAAANRLEQIQ